MGSEEPFDPRLWRDVDAYLRGLEPAGCALETRIHPADEMYRYELCRPLASRETAAILYFAAGHQIFQAVEGIVSWRFGGFGAVRSLFDFASGYGRTTRFLARELPPERILVAEIDPGAVRFQEEAFAVRGIVSGPDPASLRLESSFDAILAASFFSHLPAGRFEAWLERLYTQLSPGGVLIFSVHGMALLPEREPVDAPGTAGIVFRPVSETTRLDGAEYGTSYVTNDFVRAAAGRAAGSEGRLLEFPFGMAGYQDLYVLLKAPVPRLPALRLPRFPLGVLDGSAIRDGVVEVEGWAQGDADESPPSVRLFLGGRVGAFLRGEGESGSRRRWRFLFHVDSVDPDAIVRVEAESARGLSRILVAATLRPYLPASEKTSRGSEASG